MPTILTPSEAAGFLRTTSDDAILQQFLPLVDTYLQNATGHDWRIDNPISNTAKIAAGMLLTYWYDNPQAIGEPPATIIGALVQLEAEALKYRKYRFCGNTGAGAVGLPGAAIGDVVITLTGVYGVSGDQSAKFESTITVDGQIQQTYAGDVSASQFVVVLKHPADDVSA